MRRIATATILTAAALALPTHEAAAKYCPRVLYRATRLVIVTVPSMQATAASVRTFERKSPAARWEQRSDTAGAVVGGDGIAWGDIYETLAKKGEPLKREGDQRAPAGIFRISVASDSVGKLPGYLPLVPTKQLCVEDANARDSKAGPQSVAIEETSSGDMAKPQVGACIFLDVQGHLDAGTDARIALPQQWVAYLQEWASQRFTALAVVSEDTINRYNGCLPVSETAASGPVPPLPVRKAVAQRSG